MIRESGNRFREKIMRHQETSLERGPLRSDPALGKDSRMKNCRQDDVHGTDLRRTMVT